MKEQCPFGIVQCPFVAFGCEVGELQRCELNAHMRNCMARHLELLCYKVDDNARIIAQQQDQIEKLMHRAPLEVSASRNARFKTISDALKEAEDGDRIVVYEGVPTSNWPKTGSIVQSPCPCPWGINVPMPQTAEHCYVWIPGRACVERFLTCVRPLPRVLPAAA